MREVLPPHLSEEEAAFLRDAFIFPRPHNQLCNWDLSGPIVLYQSGQPLPFSPSPLPGKLSSSISSDVSHSAAGLLCPQWPVLKRTLTFSSLEGVQLFVIMSLSCLGSAENTSFPTTDPLTSPPAYPDSCVHHVPGEIHHSRCIGSYRGC